MKKIKVTFYMSPEDYAYLKAIIIMRSVGGRMPTQSAVICEAVRRLVK